MVSQTIQPSPGQMPTRNTLSGVGNQRQPYTLPYPRDSIYQHQQAPYPSGEIHHVSSAQPPIFQDRSIRGNPSYSGPNRNAYPGTDASWTSEPPEIARRPVPSFSPSSQALPPRPPKQPLFSHDLGPPVSHRSTSSTSTLDDSDSWSNSAINMDRRGRQPYPIFNAAHAREEPSPQPTTLTSKVSRAPSRPQEPQINDIPENNTVAAMCDACLNNITCSQTRMQCTECFDYDLCSSCSSLGRASKSHEPGHAMRRISKTENLQPHEFTPPRDDVNPETSSDGLMTFITLESGTGSSDDSVQYRWHHLHGADGHFRYLTGIAQPGHYAAHLTILPRISKSLGQNGKDELKKTGLGYLRFSVGTIKDKKQFFRTRYREDSFGPEPEAKESLMGKLLENYWTTMIKLSCDGEPIHVHANKVFAVENAEDLGLIVQWSKVRSFENDSEAIVSINIGSLMLYDIHNFTQTLPVPPSHASSNNPSRGEDPSLSEDEEAELITAEEFLSALDEIQQSVEDAKQRAQLEMAIKQRLQQQEEQRQSALLEMLFAKAVEEQVRLEKEKREQEQARRFLSLMGFDL